MVKTQATLVVDYVIVGITALSTALRPHKYPALQEDMALTSALWTNSVLLIVPWGTIAPQAQLTPSNVLLAPMATRLH